MALRICSHVQPCGIAAFGLKPLVASGSGVQATSVASLFAHGGSSTTEKREPEKSGQFVLEKGRGCQWTFHPPEWRKTVRDVPFSQVSAIAGAGQMQMMLGPAFNLISEPRVE